MRAFRQYVLFILIRRFRTSDTISIWALLEQFDANIFLPLLSFALHIISPDEALSDGHSQT